MIAQLTGAVARCEGTSVVLDVNGVGYLVSVPVPVISKLPSDPTTRITLHTHMVGRVQPDFEMALYGFLSLSDVQVFRVLLSVSGVGARVALAMLSTLSVSELAIAISTNDIKQITKVPGVGPKLAQRLCLEVGDKLAGYLYDQSSGAASTSPGPQHAPGSLFDDVVEALIGLGWGRADSKRASERAIANAADPTDTSAVISAAMQLLATPKR